MLSSSDAPLGPFNLGFTFVRLVAIILSLFSRQAAAVLGQAHHQIGLFSQLEQDVV